MEEVREVRDDAGSSKQDGVLQSKAKEFVNLVAREALPILLPMLNVGGVVYQDFEPSLACAGDVVSVPVPPILVAYSVKEGERAHTRELLTVNEAADMLRTSPDTIRRMARNKEIARVRVGGQWRILDTITLNDGTTVAISSFAKEALETPTPVPIRPSHALGNVHIRLKHVEVTSRIPDIAAMLEKPETLQIHLHMLMAALASRIEWDLLGLREEFTAHWPLGGVDAALTDELVDEIETVLFNAEALPKPYLVLSPREYKRALGFPRLKKNRAAGCIELVRSAVVNRVASGGMEIMHGMAFGRGAVGLVTRRLPSIPAGLGALSAYAETDDIDIGLRVVLCYQPNQMACEITIDMLYGCGVLRPEHGVQVVCCTPARAGVGVGMGVGMDVDIGAQVDEGACGE